MGDLEGFQGCGIVIKFIYGASFAGSYRLVGLTIRATSGGGGGGGVGVGSAPPSNPEMCFIRGRGFLSEMKK